MSLFRTTTPFLQNNGWLTQSQNALRYNTSQIGSVLPLCFGTVRQAINLVALGDYMGPGGGKKGKGVGPLPLTGTNTVSSGKGGGGKGSKGKKSQDFSVDLVVALCQGPITFNSSNQVFANSSVEPFSATADGAGKGTSGNQLYFYIGTDGQDIIHDVGASGVNYSGTCVVTATPIDLGPSPAIPNLSFEINALLYDTGGPAFTVDANPGNVVTAFLTDPRYGAGFPAANLDDLIGSGSGTTFGEYCQTAGLLISVSLDGQQRAAQWLDGMCKLLNTAPVCSGELLKFIPYGDIQFANNGAFWIPNLVPVYSLTDADFIPWHPHQDGSDPEVGQDDPILVTRTNPADAFNWYSIEYLDRTNYYNSTILAVYDQGMIDQYGLRIGDSLPGKCFANAGSAQVSAQLLLQRTLYIRNTYKFQIGWDKALLEPMDIVLLTGSAGDAYLYDEAVRVLSIEENDNGDLTVEAEEVVTGHSPAPTAVTPNPNNPGGSSAEPDFSVAYSIGAGFSVSDITPYQQVDEVDVEWAVTSTGPAVVVVFITYCQWLVEDNPPGYDVDPTVILVESSSLLPFKLRAENIMQPDYIDVLAGPGGVYKTEIWWAPAPTALTGEVVTATFSSLVRGADIAVVAVSGFSAAGINQPWDALEPIFGADWSPDGSVCGVDHMYTLSSNGVLLQFAAMAPIKQIPPGPSLGGEDDNIEYPGLDNNIPGFGDTGTSNGYGVDNNFPTPAFYMGNFFLDSGGSVDIGFAVCGSWYQAQYSNALIQGNLFTQFGLPYPWPQWMLTVDALHIS
jgi:hypothetical protein